MSERGDMAGLVAAAVAGKSLADIAAAAGLSVSSVQRRLKDSQVAAEISAARSQQRLEAVGRLAQLREHGLARLGDFVGSEDAAVALRAVALILSMSAKFDLVHDIDVRVAALEETARREVEGSELRPVGGESNVA